MLHKIKTVFTIENHIICVIYTNGEARKLDLDLLIKKYHKFTSLKKNHNLFNSVKVDLGGYGIVWNDELDLSAEGIYEQGTPLEANETFMELNRNLVERFINYRKEAKLSQKDVSHLSGVAQPAIARIEKRKTDPQLSTFIKMLSSLGLKLEIVKTN